MEALQRYFSYPGVRRALFILLVLIALYSLRQMLNLLLLLFLVTFVMGRLQEFITRKLSRFIRISPIVVLVLLYTLMLTGLVIAIVNYVPVIINQVSDLVRTIIDYLEHPDNNETLEKILKALGEGDVNYKEYLDHSLEYIKKLGEGLEIVLLVIVLSFFYLLQKERIGKFTRKFRTSKAAWIYSELEYFTHKFTASFGKVIEVQLMIAFVNTVLTMIGLWLLGFPYLIALSVMVFLLSLIPVAGVIISFIPISIIAYQNGGITLVVWTIVMILVIHAIETYFLNPKFYSDKTKLPMFYTFIILIFSEHYLGIWGLIIGIPIFMFLLDLLGVEASEA